MKNKLHIVAENGKQELFIIREFEAPREMVFEAFRNPDIYVQFFGPADGTMTLTYFDFKDRGSYRYTHQDKAGNLMCAFKGAIHEVAAPERIVQTAELEGLPEGGHVVLETILFEALPNDRTKLTFHEVCRSVADRDAMAQSGMEIGLGRAFERLDKMMEKGFKH